MMTNFHSHTEAFLFIIHSLFQDFDSFFGIACSNGFVNACAV